MYIFAFWWENSVILPESCKRGHFIQLTVFVIQYEESLCYYMNVMNFPSTEVCSSVVIIRSFILWAWLYQFSLLPSFFHHLSLSHPLLLGLDFGRLFILLMFSCLGVIVHHTAGHTKIIGPCDYRGRNSKIVKFWYFGANWPRRKEKHP